MRNMQPQQLQRMSLWKFKLSQGLLILKFHRWQRKGCAGRGTHGLHSAAQKPKLLLLYLEEKIPFSIK